MDTGYTFRASWPIRDHDRPMSMLRTEAAGHVDTIAADVGARIVGPVTWTFTDHHLIGEAPAVPEERAAGSWAAPGSVRRQEARIRELATGHGWTDRQIAEVLGCTASGVAKARKHADPPIAAGSLRGRRIAATFAAGNVLPFERRAGRAA